MFEFSTLFHFYLFLLAGFLGLVEVSPAFVSFYWCNAQFLLQYMPLKKVFLLFLILFFKFPFYNFFFKFQCPVSSTWHKLKAFKKVFFLLKFKFFHSNWISHFSACGSHWSDLSFLPCLKFSKVPCSISLKFLSSLGPILLNWRGSYWRIKPESLIQNLLNLTTIYLMIKIWNGAAVGSSADFLNFNKNLVHFLSDFLTFIIRILTINNIYL